MITHLFPPIPPIPPGDNPPAPPETDEEDPAAQWGVFERPDSIHVIPLNDRQDHNETPSCPCSPRVECHFPRPLVVHNAFDYREIVERLEEEIQKNSPLR